MRIRHIALAVTALLVAAAVGAGPALARKSIEGSGKLETRTLDVDDFVAVEIDGVFDVTIEVGGDTKIEATLDDNLFEHFIAKVSGSKLKLDFDKDCDPSDECVIRITVPSLEGVELNGVGDVEISGVDGNRFELVLQGVGDIEVDGKVGDLRVSLMGVGDVEARGLEADNVKVTLSGVGDCEVYAAKSIDARVSGVGDLAYWGDPEQRDTEISGMGDIDSR